MPRFPEHRGARRCEQCLERIGSEYQNQLVILSRFTRSQDSNVIGKWFEAMEYGSSTVPLDTYASS